jgi:H+/Cl- antiporter ClcA
MQMKKISTHLLFILKWLFITIMTAVLVGSATAWFLIALDFVTIWRTNQIWVVNFLPLMGLGIGFAYHYFGTDAKKGNNLILEIHQATETTSTTNTTSTISSSTKPIPLIMAPLVFISSLLTHLGGGSAGREGTAVQIGGAIADQFTSIFKLSSAERKTILIMGVSAGFAAVFGTPFAAAIFALEIMSFRKVKFENIIPSFAAAFGAHYICLAWMVKHTVYSIDIIPSITISTISWTMLAGLIFGLAAFLFIYTGKIFEALFSKIKFEPMRPFIGGIIIALFIVVANSTKYIGLGIPSIMDAFNEPAGNFDFALKLLLTSLTLSAGFKGGEVTPLFFIGATLGNVLIWFIPLPMVLLAGMGFVAVFAGATHCVIASIIMGVELFGIQAGIYVGLASMIAYFTSGINGIYSAKLKIGAKYDLYNYILKTRKL